MTQWRSDRTARFHLPDAHRTITVAGRKASIVRTERQEEDAGIVLERRDGRVARELIPDSDGLVFAAGGDASSVMAAPQLLNVAVVNQRWTNGTASLQIPNLRLVKVRPPSCGCRNGETSVCIHKIKLMLRTKLKLADELARGH